MTVMHWYTAGWLYLCLVAVGLVVRTPSRFTLLQRNYWLLLIEPWKLATALVATVGFMVMAPYTGDPTWDYVDAFFMSALTYATAPWSVAVLYRVFRRWESWQAFYVALCCWFFTASWSYDLYIWIRDGYYPLTWTSNIVASSFLYLMAGLLWNLEWQADRGTQFAFSSVAWPAPAPQRSWRIVWIAVPIIVLVAILMGQFLANP
ncbi:hypothetical protein FY034_06670 [Trichlorobacter lovleyi]|nr:hypothetical protein FY034_06670 [Trichlorobacter lovleyi]